jgi:Uri superfamily endonuclease
MTGSRPAPAGRASGGSGSGADAPVSYQLSIDVPLDVRVVVGALGACDFPRGRYVYTGSAKRALEARIRRHLSARKRKHWHIDHLLAVPGVQVIGVRRSARPECCLNATTRGRIVVPGFGASDCRAGCGSHLKRVGEVRPKPHLGSGRRETRGA